MISKINLVKRIIFIMSVLIIILSLIVECYKVLCWFVKITIDPESRQSKLLRSKKGLPTKSFNQPKVE